MVGYLENSQCTVETRSSFDVPDSVDWARPRLGQISLHGWIKLGYNTATRICRAGLNVYEYNFLFFFLFFLIFLYSCDMTCLILFCHKFMSQIKKFYLWHFVSIFGLSCDGLKTVTRPYWDVTPFFLYITVYLYIYPTNTCYTIFITLLSSQHLSKLSCTK